jgi:hypothetical protein
MCANCGENESVWLDTVKGDILADGSVSDGSGEYMPVCIDCYDDPDERTYELLREFHGVGETDVVKEYVTATDADGTIHTGYRWAQ